MHTHTPEKSQLFQYSCEVSLMCRSKKAASLSVSPKTTSSCQWASFKSMMGILCHCPCGVQSSILFLEIAVICVIKWRDALRVCLEGSAVILFMNTETLEEDRSLKLPVSY